MEEINDWVFSEQKNVEVFSTVRIIHGGVPILEVTHDEEYSAW